MAVTFVIVLKDGMQLNHIPDASCYGLDRLLNMMKSLEQKLRSRTSSLLEVIKARRHCVDEGGEEEEEEVEEEEEEEVVEEGRRSRRLRLIE